MSKTESSPLHDAYTEALLDLGQKTACVAQEDIYNEFGVLLVKKGDPIRDSTADRLREHRLEKPIDDVVGLQQRLSSRNLFAVCTRLFEQQTDLGFICAEEDTALRIRHWCMHRELNSAVAQKLTVMMRTRPPVFERTLAGAVLAGLIAREAGLSPERQAVVFDAALIRDLGTLHQPLEAQPQDPRLHEQAIEHLALGARIADQCRSYDDSIREIVEQHHERPDGLGVPKGMTSCRPEAAVIEMADRTWAHMRAWQAEGALPLTMCIPWLRAQMRGPGSELVQALLRILLREPLPLPVPEMSSGDIQARVMERSLYVSQVFSLLPVLLDALSGVDLAVLPAIQMLTGYVAESGFGNLESLEMIALEGDAGMSPEELREVDMAQCVFLDRARRLCARLSQAADLPENAGKVVQELAMVLEPVDTRTFWETNG
ncbi:MAG: hypothetical protein D6758_01875 [Gammaproteobacteria bacterium]|nr:MAG: hypothetical protein D6758_01875 [Gammaproteobacteria bacterium]